MQRWKSMHVLQMLDVSVKIAQLQYQYIFEFVINHEGMTWCFLHIIVHFLKFLCERWFLWFPALMRFLKDVLESLRSEPSKSTCPKHTVMISWYHVTTWRSWASTTGNSNDVRVQVASLISCCISSIFFSSGKFGIQMCIWFRNHFESFWYKVNRAGHISMQNWYKYGAILQKFH